MENKTYYTRLALTVLAVVVVMVLARVLFWSPATTRSDSKPTTAPSSSPTEAGKRLVISWRDAADHYGETCTVEGEIVATHNSGKACFLNFHPNWSKYFTAVIFASAFDQFPPNPEEHYRGKEVRVTGRIKEYKGKPEIILNSPSQIEIVD